MKKLVLATMMTVSFAVMAEEVTAYVQDHYTNSTRRIPNTQQVCQEVDVPVYSSQPENSQGGILLGAIIGNAIGRAAGVDGGQTAGTIIGGIAGNEIARGQRRNEIAGYRREQRCNNQTTYDTSTETVYSHSTITFIDSNGNRKSITFRR
jgi:uncharacterized protein YcfJ